MNLARLLCVIVACLVMQPSFSQEYSSEELQRLRMRNVQHLCEWSKSHAPPGNTVEISACATDADVSLEQAERDADAWWTYWSQNDDATFDRLRKEWDEERARTDAEYLAERRVAAQKQAKADHAKLVASIPSMNIADLCRVVRRGKTPEALEELTRRKAFAVSETALIARREINLGMSEGAMICALGAPTRANRSVGSWGVHIQYVYSGLIVYIENGKITSWQD